VRERRLEGVLVSGGRSVRGGSEEGSSVELREVVGRRSTRHKGQVPETLRSQGSMHSGWNL